MRSWEGARVTELAVTHHPRKFGKSKYGLGRIARVILDGLIVYFIDRAFDRPIQFFGKLGFLSFGLSSLVMLWALGLKYLANVESDPDATAIARSHHRIVRHPIHPAGRDGRDADAHLF